MQLSKITNRQKIFLLVISFSVTILTAANVSARDSHLDKNFVSFYQHQGYEYFLKKDSLQWEIEDSLRYVYFSYIVYDNIRPEKTNWSNEKEMAFAYDVDERKVYFVEEDGTLKFLNPEGTIAEGSGYAAGAEIVYYLVFGEKFYGTYEEDFYNNID